MQRRGFIGALMGAAVLDPEKLLWVPGKKLISIPAPAVPVHLRLMSLYNPVQGGYVHNATLLFPDKTIRLRLGADVLNDHREVPAHVWDCLTQNVMDAAFLRGYRHLKITQRTVHSV